MARQLNAIYDRSLQVYLFDCASTKNVPDLVFTISGKDHIVPGKSLLFPLTRSLC